MSNHTPNKIAEWLQRVVVIDRKNRIYRGYYDGMGNVVDRQDVPMSLKAVLIHTIDYKKVPSIFHEICYKCSGEPKKFLVASKNDIDQGLSVITAPPPICDNKIIPAKRASLTKTQILNYLNTLSVNVLFYYYYQFFDKKIDDKHILANVKYAHELTKDQYLQLYDRLSIKELRSFLSVNDLVQIGRQY